MPKSNSTQKGRVQPPFSLVKPPPVGERPRASLPVGGYENEVLLGKEYTLNKNPNDSKVQLLAEQLEITENIVRLWFERQRNRDPASPTGSGDESTRAPGELCKTKVSKLIVAERMARAETPPLDPRFSDEERERARMARRAQQFQFADPKQCLEYDQEDYESWLLAKVEIALRHIVKLLGWTTFEEWTDWVMSELGMEKYHCIQRWLIYWMEILGFRCFLQALASEHEHVFGFSEESVERQESDLTLVEDREGSGLPVRLSHLQNVYETLELHLLLNTVHFWVYASDVVRKIVDLDKLVSPKRCAVLNERLHKDLDVWKTAPYKPFSGILYGGVTPDVIHSFFRTPVAAKGL